MKEQKDLAKNLLKAEILKRFESPGIYPTDVKGLLISRYQKTSGGEQCFFSPFIGVVLQGLKKSVIGGKEYRYGEGDCVAVCMDSPAITEVIEASDDAPLLFAGIAFERIHFTQFETITGASSKIKDSSGQVAAVFKASHEITDAFLRLVRLLDRPEQISALAPLIIKEIHYLVLSEPQSNNLRLCSTPGTFNSNITNAVLWLKQNFRKPLKVEELAQSVKMSSPTFHRHFRGITSYSPIQFQKLMRLNEARRLLLAEGKDATAAAAEVGYESVTQFNREYKRHFGEPPKRHIAKMYS